MRERRRSEQKTTARVLVDIKNRRHFIRNIPRVREVLRMRSLEAVETTRSFCTTSEKLTVRSANCQEKRPYNASHMASSFALLMLRSQLFLGVEGSQYVNLTPRVLYFIDDAGIVCCSPSLYLESFVLDGVYLPPWWTISPVIPGLIYYHNIHRHCTHRYSIYYLPAEQPRTLHIYVGCRQPPFAYQCPRTCQYQRHTAGWLAPRQGPDEKHLFLTAPHFVIPQGHVPMR